MGDIRKPIRSTSQISTNTFKFKMNFITLISVTLSCLVISSLSAPAPQPLIWPGRAGAVAFDLATGLSIAGLGAATIPTSLLVAKGLVAKKLVLLSALAASRNQRRNQRRN